MRALARTVSISLAAVAVLSMGGPAQAQQNTTFHAQIDRTQGTLDDALIYEVTLNDGDFSNFQAPEFKGFRVLGMSGPNQMMNMQMLGGRTTVQRTVTWRYQLQPAQKGSLVIGPARVHVGGRELRTSSITVAIGESSAPPPMAPQPGAAGAAAPPPVAGTQKANFLRVVPSKQKVYVGEQVVVTWYIYLSQRQDKYATLVEPRTDGFWSEDLPVPNNRTPLSMTREVIAGREYSVSPLLKKALFPLKPGRLVIGGMESEIAQVDFFGAALRTQRLKADPMPIEVLPLPKGAPAGFDNGNIGNLALSVHVDRNSIQTGEAATLTIEAKGQGNVRSWHLPKLSRLEGWKMYEPRTTVNVEPGGSVAGSKLIEVLMVPERPGTTVIPALEMSYFDPETGRYHTERTEPLPILVSGDATVARTDAKPGGAPSENVLGLEIRPINNGRGLHRDLGATLYRSQAFLGFLLAPPLALVLVGLTGRIRERLAEDTQGARRRRVRRLVRRRLRAARNHLRDHETASFFIEIERVLREVLSARLGRPVAGLRQDELRETMLSRGMNGELVDRVLTELEECDRARFAPGGVDTDDMTAILDRAGDLILSVEKARIHETEVAS